MTLAVDLKKYEKRKKEEEWKELKEKVKKYIYALAFIRKED